MFKKHLINGPVPTGKCSSFNGSVCGCMLTSWINNGNYRILKEPWTALGFQPIKSALVRHSGVQVPVPTYGSTWVVLWLLFFRSAPSTFNVTWSTLKGPFRGVPSLRLYSEIDNIHLSSEAQCVSHHLPLVDCHTEYEHRLCRQVGAPLWFSPTLALNLMIYQVHLISKVLRHQMKDIE